MGLKSKRRQKPEETTRDRILRHAIARFSKQSYDSTGLREIASDAGVDVAFVHRSFGSKQQLFVECLTSSLKTDHILADPGPGTLLRLIEDVSAPRVDGDFRPIDLIIRSFSSPEASEVIRDVSNSKVIAPLAAVYGQENEVNIVLTLAALFGFAIMRDVIGVEALKHAKPEEISRHFGKVCESVNQT
ncbi:TetR family transcriptional regulator [Rhizobium sp.]|jgi:AcrR family transcriptional regulator|uniref:TetR/AcrR family transcriptional regulator n=1 Tax=Rhizobium sp. TaxID=391 RepID=UPI000E8EF45E|nr:TetR family transcriptional regulator [Rhizobium sp.]